MVVCRRWSHLRPPLARRGRRTSSAATSTSFNVSRHATQPLFASIASIWLIQPLCFSCVDYAADPLCLHSPLSSASLSSLVSLLSFVSSHFSSLSTPFLVQHGLRDLVCSPHGTRLLLQRTPHLSAFDKRLIVHSRSWHALLHEMEGEKVVEMTVEWMMQRTEHVKQTVSLD